MIQLLMTALLHCFYLALYISGQSSFPRPLSPKEERECFLRMKEGDVESRDRLIERNLRLVAHMVKKYYSSPCDQEDLLSIGTVGLIKAIRSFDIEKGTRFSTYAARCIENEILMHFRACRKLQAEVSLSEPIDSDREGNSLSLADVLCSEDNIDEQVELQLQSSQLYRLVEEVLTPREKEILSMRYGLFGRIPMTQREVAVKMDISRSYVSRRGYCK
ncbi:MAG: RNA polymerase sporulation sigma factor SigK [Eubacteriales bacterium]|jgi:RNA polymerase sporulation-specific sigma factor